MYGKKKVPKRQTMKMEKAEMDPSMMQMKKKSVKKAKKGKK